MQFTTFLSALLLAGSTLVVAAPDGESHSSSFAMFHLLSPWSLPRGHRRKQLTDVKAPLSQRALCKKPLCTAKCPDGT
jgi:hypothetical protein